MDPLRSFATLLGSLWRPKSVARARNASGPAPAAQRQHSSSGTPEEVLRSRLQSRIAKIGTADPKRARETFVAAVLSWQFGDQLEQDPQFGEIVGKLSAHIEAQPALSQRLTELLGTLAKESSAVR